MLEHERVRNMREVPNGFYMELQRQLGWPWHACFLPSRLRRERICCIMLEPSVPGLVQLVWCVPQRVLCGSIGWQRHLG